MNLKERFEEYQPQPDEQVWQSIEKTMHHKVVMHRAIGISAATVAVAAVTAGVLFLTQRPAESIVEQLVVAQEIVMTEQASTVATASVVADEATVIPTVVSEVATPKARTTEPAPAPTTVATVAEETPAEPAELSGAIEKAPAPRPTIIFAAQTEPEKEQNSTAAAEKTATKAPTNANAPSITPQDELVVWIPNAFAPDYSDPAVQQFIVKHNDEANIRSYEIFIYNRAGRQVYHSKDINAGWDGTYNGHKQPSGAYVYLIQINDINKGLQHTKGTITLIR